MALKQVKSKINSTRKTGKVTKAMEAVSAVKMRKSQERALSGKAFAEAAVRILHRISKSIDGKKFFNRPESTDGKECYIIITSDKGLAGSLNSAVIKDLAYALRDNPKDDVRIIAFGKKAAEHFRRSGYTLDEEHTNISDDVSLDDMREVTHTIVEKFNAHEYRKVTVVYQSFISTFEQNALMRQILPLDPTTLEIMVRDIIPKKGKYSGEMKDIGDRIYTVEPRPDEVIRVLVPQLVHIMLYHALLENKASEHSARMVAMKNATDKSKEMLKSLQLQYNKERQAAITAEVSEITGGIEALKNN